MFDLDKARRETPGVNHVVHLNNAGAALMPQAVLDAVKAHLELEAHTGGYEAARAREGELSAVYTRWRGCWAAIPMKWRWWKTPPGLGTWPFTASPSGRET